MPDHDELGPSSSFYISQRLRLHFVDWGGEAKPPLFLVHGGRDHARSWDWVARALRDEDHVIAPDLRGHGDSARPLFPQRMDADARARMWRRISCPTLARACGAASAVRRSSSMAPRAGTATLRPTAAPTTSPTPKSWASRKRATGSTTTSSKASSIAPGPSSATDLGLRRKEWPWRVLRQGK